MIILGGKDYHEFYGTYKDSGQTGIAMKVAKSYNTTWPLIGNIIYKLPPFLY